VTTAVVVIPGDPDDIAAKIVAVVADRAAWAGKVARAREWSQAHTFDWTIAALAGVVREALEG